MAGQEVVANLSGTELRISRDQFIYYLGGPELMPEGVTTDSPHDRPHFPDLKTEADVVDNISRTGGLIVRYALGDRLTRPVDEQAIIKTTRFGGTPLEVTESCLHKDIKKLPELEKDIAHIGLALVVLGGAIREYMRGPTETTAFQARGETARHAITPGSEEERRLFKERLGGHQLAYCPTTLTLGFNRHPSNAKFSGSITVELASKHKKNENHRLHSLIEVGAFSSENHITGIDVTTQSHEVDICIDPDSREPSISGINVLGEFGPLLGKYEGSIISGLYDAITFLKAATNLRTDS